MLITVDVQRPANGQKIYVPSGEGYLGGLATIKLMRGSMVCVAEVPFVEFDWEELVKHQVEYIKEFWTAKARTLPAQIRRAV